MNNTDFSATGPVSQCYLFLGNCFSFPGDPLTVLTENKEGMNLLKASIAELPFPVEWSDFPKPSLSKEELKNYYISVFDIGQEGKSPASPLYEGLTRKDEARESIMMELLRFYHYFDMKLQEEGRDFPDHLVAELEFMAFLSQKEATALERGKNSHPYRFAQLDFLERHLDRWVPALNERISQRVEEPFYTAASAFMAAFITAHLSWLRKNVVREKGKEKTSETINPTINP